MLQYFALVYLIIFGYANGISCTTGEDCPHTAPRCPSGTCDTCKWPVNCERYTGYPICDKVAGSATLGQCITCVGRDNAWCGETRNDALQNVCDPSTGKCVYCLENTDCTEPTPICNVTSNANTCVPCTDNSDCSDVTKSVCDTSTGICGSCADDTGCQHFDDLTICDVDAGTCVECTAGDPHCPSTAPKCTNNVCVDCNWPVNCERFDGLPMCDKDDTSATIGQCITCVGRADAWCGDTRTDPLQNVCDSSTGKCVYCLENTDCTNSAAPMCNVADNTCVSCDSNSVCCMDNSDCSETSAAECDVTTRTCGSCTSDSGCEHFGTNFGDLRICDVDAGTCVECTSGDPHCPSTDPKCTNNVCVDCNWPVNCERFDGLPMCDKDDTSATLGQCVTCVGRADAWCGDTRTDPLQNVCDPSTGKCVYCLENTDCADPTPICDDTNTCVPCADNSDCTDVSKSVCDTVTGVCGSCADDAGCAHFGANFGDLRICDVDAGTCVECTFGDPHCPSTDPKCTNNVCVNCNWPVNCERFDGLPICDKDDTSATVGQCISCVGRADAWCGETRTDPLQNVCDPSTGKCVYSVDTTQPADTTQVSETTDNLITTEGQYTPPGSGVARYGVFVAMAVVLLIILID